MRFYTVTVVPDSIEGRHRVFVVRLRAALVAAALATVAVGLVAALLLWGVVFPYNRVAAGSRLAERFRLENGALGAAAAEARDCLRSYRAELALHLLLTEKLNQVLGIDDGESGGYPLGDRSERAGEDLLDTLTLLERRLVRYGELMDLIESVPMRLPLRGPVTVSSRFGPRRSPFTNDVEMHNGIDFSAPVGTEIQAAGGGVVTFAGRDGYQQETDYAHLGLFVRIEHRESGYVTLYGHCSRLLVSSGDEVRAGQPIALVGNTGWSTSPHLHFSIMWGRRYLDPEDFLLYFDAERMRLALTGRPREADIGGH